MRGLALSHQRPEEMLLESLLMLLAPVRDVLTQEREPRTCVVCACSPLLGQYLARERTLTRVQKYLFVYLPLFLQKVSLPQGWGAM